MQGFRSIVRSEIFGESTRFSICWYTVMNTTTPMLCDDEHAQIILDGDLLPQRFGAWNKTSTLAFLNAPLLTYSSEIRSACLLIHGEKAHSRYFSEDAFKKLTGDNKELLIVPGAFACR